MNHPAASQSSECSSVLDLSCTYNISDSLLQPDPTPGTLEDDSSCALISSLSSSLNNTGYKTSLCEDDEKLKLKLEDNESCSSSSIVREQRNCTMTSLPKPETNEDIDDAQMRANLDAFYELSSLPANDAFSQRLTEKISELKQTNNLYALRSFQIAKIILQQEGTKVLQSCTNDNVFSSTGGATDIKPVPGISDDVVRFLMDRKPTKEGP
ncbi:shieldin complex subunit 1 [Pyxicephalus adspersus]|uniref:shieldin complex subunit 1 n=1 Tax=Pyxicephalus adspersus TaxID=30357 RepID=UPI003B5B89C9